MDKRQPESALSGVLRAGRSGVLASAPGVQLSEMQPAAVFQLSGTLPRDESSGLPAFLRALKQPGPQQWSATEGVRLLWNGPNRLLATIDRDTPFANEERSLHGEDAGELACVDVSHAWSVLRVQGLKARDLLAKGCTVDLELMQSGACRPTSIGRFDVMLCCIAADGFDLFVARSLAQSFADWLLRAGAEFGVTVCEWQAGKSP